MEPRWLTPHERETWLHVVAVLELLPAALDSQLRTDSGITHFEFFVLAVLSDAEGNTLRMTQIAQNTNSTLPRLSHVIRRLEERDYVERIPCPEDRRATNARLTASGRDALNQAAPGHVAAVRKFVFDPLKASELDHLRGIAKQLLRSLDPDRQMSGLYDQ